MSSTKTKEKENSREAVMVNRQDGRETVEREYRTSRFCPSIDRINQSLGNKGVSLEDNSRSHHFSGRSKLNCSAHSLQKGYFAMFSLPSHNFSKIKYDTFW